ncbi:Dihydrofolate reductase [Penicillium chrysogenum]|uniref:Dihydrofolate reductase n=2 Tax=Penicillium chrysogenum species complex TaxID=254878 RepID=A0A167Q2D4_PENCH|nr:Dihydrofolate reductase [Penicillium chrysogenum]
MLLRFERPKDDTRESISGPKYPYLSICPFINMDSESTAQSAMLSRPKILMLHGHAQSGHTLQCKTEYLKPRVTDTILNALQQDPSSGSADVVEFHYPSGRWPAKRDQLPGESNHLWAWGQADNPDDYACGLERSVNDTFRYIERNGPFLGIIGFSMGAAMGAIIASLLEKRHSIGNFKFDTDHPPLKFVVAVCGFTFGNPIYNDLYSPKIETPIFLAIASIDTIIAESASLRLRDSSTNTAVYVFQGAHYVPRDELFLEALVHFIEDVFSIKENHEDDWEDYED